MKTHYHKMANTEICIYFNDHEILKGCFFKNKPEVGDLLMSHAIRTTNNYALFEIQSIDDNRDALISSDCGHDPKLAYFGMTIKNVSNDERYENIDTSIKTNGSIMLN